jgi:Family of unknown function (DUF6325)
MKDDLDQMGPVDYLVIEFPGSRLTGEGLPMLVDLVDRRIIRILDLRFAKKLADGTVIGLTMGELADDGAHAVAVFAGVSSGLLDRDDLDEIGDVLEPGSSAAVLVYENVWAAPLAGALRRAGGRLVAGGRVSAPALIASLDALEASEDGQVQSTTRG